MNKKIILFLIVILFTVLSINAQTADWDFDLRAGLGISQLKHSNTLWLINEYEFNARLTNHIAIAPSMAINFKDRSKSDEPNFFHLNLNVFASPFRNDRLNDFRIGSGLSFYKINKGGFTARSAFGLNLILEDTFMLNDIVFIGIKGFFQPYFNKEANKGILLKIGVNL